MPSDPLQFLINRRSVPSRQLSEPGPSAEQLAALVDAAVRVPDHGRLTPWRLIEISGDARTDLGEALARIHRTREPDTKEAALEKDRQRFNHAPVVLTVVAQVSVPHKIPEIEQVLSAGCVALNLLLGAQALGFAAQWLTGWAAYDLEVHRVLGLDAHERIVGFVHIGTANSVTDHPDRPEDATVLTRWNARPTR